MAPAPSPGGVIAARTGELPPRLHNLMQLAKHAGLKPEASQARLMRELSEYYIQCSLS